MTTQRLFLQRIILLLMAAVIFSHSAMAQNATANATAKIAEGRAKLALQTPTGLQQADTAFAAALTSVPNNLEANLLKAATSLLLEQNSTQFSTQLTGVGVTSSNNNNIYQPQYVLPRDAAGNLQPTAGVTTNSTLAYINSKTALIDNALANLNKFTSNATGFQITLNATETAMADARVAYADVVMLRAFLKGAKAYIALANSYNFNAEYAALFNLDKTGELTPQKVLELLPDLLKFANSAQRATAKDLLISANTDYQAAHAIIKNRSVTVNGTPYLFEYGDPVEADTYAAQISGLVASLNSGGNFNLNTVNGALTQPLGITINPNAFFTATQPLRSFITSNSSGFEYGYPTRTSWPDPTFGGFISTNSVALLDSLDDWFLKDARLGRRLQLSSQRPVRTGTVRAWGNNASGQTTVPAGLTNVVQLATGGNHTLALKADGSVVAWGDNAQSLPNNLPIINQISAGANHSLALTANGTVRGWGDNAFGQAPYHPYGLDNVVQVSAGGTHSLALKSDGTLVAWGDNSSGQAPWTWSPMIRNLNRIVQVSAGGSHSLALTSYGSVVAWGNNTSNQTTVPTGYTQASFGWSLGLAAYGSGNSSVLYVADADSNKIRQITANGIVSTFAGSGEYSYYGPNNVNGTATTFNFNDLRGAAVDTNGNVYVADNNVIRKISLSGNVSTLAGSDYNWGSEDGFGASASFSWNAGGIAVASDGTIYVTDTGNNKIRKISSSGDVTTLAGSGARGSTDGSGATASFNDPYSLAVYGSGNNTIVYVADYQNNKIRKITANGMVTTFAGNGTAGFADGNGTAARFNKPEGIAVDSSGNVYVADSMNNRIRKITPNGTVTTLAGSGFPSFTDGNGTVASFLYPNRITVSNSGTLYVGDCYKIRTVTFAGVVTTFAGAETNGSTDGSALMAAGNRITQIAAGGAHSVALNANGTVIAWGSNAAGQTSVPQGLNNVVQIAAGQNHSMAIKADGTVVTWGNTASDLGTIPTGMTNPAQVAAGGAHSAVLFTPNPPVVGSATIPAQVGVSFSYTMNATNQPGAYSATGLPAGLALNTTTGFISGTPTVAGNASVSVLATNAGGNATGTLTINVAKGNQTISGLASSDSQTVGAIYSLNATTNSGLPLVYTSSNNAVATISNGTIRLNAVGNVNITASQLGNANWNSASRSQALSVVAISANQAISLGRDQLKLQTPSGLLGADGYLTQALTSDPNNLEANLLKAATTLLLEQSSAQFLAQLTGIGVTVNNPNLYHFEYLLPVDANGKLQPTAGVNTDGTLAYLNSKVGLIDSALNNLGKFSNNSTGFRITLNATETSLADTRVDYADVMMLRAFLKGAKAFIALANSYDLTAEYAVLFNLAKTKELTLQKILEVLPDLFKFADASQRTAARALLISANADYQAAHAFIKNGRLPAGQIPYLFEYGDVEEADSYATLVNGLVNSLNAGTNYTLTLEAGDSFPGGNVTVNPAAFFSSGTAPRYFITSNSSAFEFGYPTRNSWPDPTFGGVIPSGSGLLLEALENDFKDLRFEQRLLQMRKRPTTNGTLRLWGNNASGQTTVPAGLTNVVQVATGGNHTLALKADGSVVAWGDNAYGQGSLPAVVTTLAGTGVQGSVDGNGSAARFFHPHGLAVDGVGNIYLADRDNHKIRKITPAGQVTTLAGSGTAGAVDGNGTNARFNVPAGVAVDGSGNVYVTDHANHKIRKITPAGQVTTLAGSGTTGAVDGNGTSASFYEPNGIAVDGAGNVYVADSQNDKIRKITPAGQVTTLAGSGTTGAVDGNGTSASFNHPIGVAVDGLGNLYVTDQFNHKIRKITPAGQVTTLAGSGTAGAVDGNGTSAAFYQPHGVTVDGLGNVYVGDYLNNKIRKITPAGLVTTLAGSGVQGSVDGDGTISSFYGPVGVAVDGVGNIYVADIENNKIRKISQGSLSGVNQISAGANHSLALTADGNVLGWGDNTSGQVRPPYWYGLNDVVQISAGRNHSLALKADGSIVAWGDNTLGQAPAPWNLSGVDKIVQVAAGGTHSLALGVDGSLLAFGNNEQGQTSVPYGHALASFSATVAGLNTTTPLVKVAAGGAHSVALRSNGTVVAWGDNTFGQCSVPVGLRDVVQIAAGETHSIAIKSDGTVVAWGNNASGQRIIPAGIINPLQVTAGGAHSAVLFAPIAPVVVPATVTAQVGVPMSYKVNALNLPSAFASTGLPAGLSLNATSGFISGTPSVAGNASVNVTASNSGGNGTGTIGINVAKGNQAIYGVATNTTRTVNATYSLNATSSANLTLSYSSLNPNVATVAANGTVSVIGAGTATLTVNQSGNANYNPAPSVFQVLTAIANSPTINLIPPSNLTYDSLPKNFTATANGVSEFNYVYTGRNATSYKASALAPALAGEYTVNVKSPATSTMAAGAASANFTITRKPLTVSFGNLTKSYDGTTGISYVSTLVGKVGTDDVTLGGNRTLAFANAMVGTNKPINATGVNLLLGSKAPNYQLNSTSNLTGSITPKTVTLKANDVSKVFGSNLTTSNGSTAFTVIGLVSPDVIGSVTITYGNGNASAAAPGVYAGQVTPSAAVFTSGNSTNYSLTYVSGNLNVSAPPPTLNRALGGSASSTFTVRWSAVAGATGYNVERSLSANMSNSTIATTGNATSFTLNATGNSLNFVRVRGVGSAGNGTWSDIQAVQHIMIPANGTMYVAPAVNPGTGNYTVNGVFGSVNEAGLTPSSSPNTATQILQLANGTATAPIYFSTNGNWTKNATAAGSTSLPAGSAFALKNTQSSVRYIALSGRIYSNATTSNVTLSGQNKSTLIGTLRSRPSTLNDLNLRPGLTNGLFSASSQASADQVLFNEPSGALSIYWYNSSANRWYLNSVPAIPNPIVPAGAGILIRRATSSLFNTWTPPVD